MNMLEKFKDKQLDAQSMKHVKGGHDVVSWYSCVLENGVPYDLPVNVWESLEGKIDGHNEEYNLAIVGCEAQPWNN